jgi:hypothetical protein
MILGILFFIFFIIFMLVGFEIIDWMGRKEANC